MAFNNFINHQPNDSLKTPPIMFSNNKNQSIDVSQNWNDLPGRESSSLKKVDIKKRVVTTMENIDQLMDIARGTVNERSDGGMPFSLAKHDTP